MKSVSLNVILLAVGTTLRGYEGRKVVYLGSESEGTVRWDLQDAGGKFFIQDIIAAGRAGGGFVDCSRRNPSDRQHHRNLRCGRGNRQDLSELPQNDRNPGGGGLGSVPVLQSDSSQGSKTTEAVSAAVARITAQSENLQETNQANTSVASQTILEEMIRLVRISQEVQSSMSEIAHGTEEINTAIHATFALTIGTKESIDAADRRTQRFRL